MKGAKVQEDMIEIKGNEQIGQMNELLLMKIFYLSVIWFNFDFFNIKFK